LQPPPPILTFGCEATDLKVAEPFRVERNDLPARSLVTGAAASES
jgi:hypothetical protein